ncbi:MAG: 1-acyl-sn-glycerol-3-phosphate acyltransferase [Oscillospiraceae bacterium]|nr:1-acyl-sn-glycerol-3-phosphate acyltransferase [Oscillospiraceae bacterium]
MKLRKLVWSFCYWFIRCFIAPRFHFEAEPADVQGPFLMISNHVTPWDPLLLGLSFPKTPMRYVASEHLFRHGWVSRVIERLAGPIPRRKASSGADTVKACLRALRDGENVGIFAEGDACWDGLSHEVFPATGKLARSSGATLVTYRLEGGYPTLPRWSKKRRPGKMRGHVVGVYTPEELKSMKGPEITALINRDIFEDAWARQRAEHVVYRAEDRAEGIEKGFFLCPSCRKIGTLRGVANAIKCSCGLRILYTEQGFLEPSEPFETLADWDAWQYESLRTMEFPAGVPVFFDGGMTLRGIRVGHGEEELARGELTQYPDALACGDRRFPLTEIASMAMVKANILLFSVGDDYYEIRADHELCLRKYLLFWQCSSR